MSGNVVLVGTYSYAIYPTTNTVQLTAAQLQNIGASSTGTVRIELWLTTTPWNQNGSNTGYEIATDQLHGSSNGTLGVGQYFANINDTVSFINHPPAGTYFVTMAVAEYTGASPNVDNGFVIDSAQTFSQFLIVGSDGKLSSGAFPTVSIASQFIVEGDSGTKNLVFTLNLSSAVPYTSTVQVDTRDETAVAGIDYLGLHQTVTFNPGTTTATVSVPIVGNTLFQPSRAFEVNLSNAVGVNVAPNYLDPTGTLQNFAQASSWGIIVDDDKSPGFTFPTDTYFELQWYLYSTRTEFAWQHATGKGIKIGVFDQGIDSANPDLRLNDNVALGRSSLSLSAGGSPLTASDNHGTHVAGIIAAARDGNGIVGVAYDSQLVSIYTPSTISPQYLLEIANAFHYAASLDVLNNSWGFGNLLQAGTNWAFYDDAQNPSFSPAFQALHDAVASGRGGLGTVVVQSAGNAFNYGDDTNLHNFQNSRYVITVGATDYFGTSSGFSTTGASILISAPGGAGNRNFASIFTTDRTGSDGDNAGNYAFDDGTSFSSPIVSGIVALMLEVNPKLGFRDVQQILAYTAHQTDPSATNWSTNGATDWNGGGLRYNSVEQSSGFGQVDALAATRLAATWDSTPRTVANTVDIINTQNVNLTIPDNNLHGVTSGINISSSITVERVDVTVNITHPFIGDLEIALLSPTGTASYLMYRPSQGSLSALGSSQHDIHFTFDTVLDWGENSKGTWILNVRDLKGGDIGSLSNWTIDIIGHNSTSDHTFIYTNEYPQLVAAAPARAILSDPSGGLDTINASALGSDDRIDLSGASASIIYGQNLTIEKGTIIRNAYGGDGNDVLIANQKGSVLHGMAGNDTFTGGDGNDTFDGGAGDDLINGGAGFDISLYHGPRSNYVVTKTAGGYAVLDNTGAEGNDHLTQIEQLQFDDTTFSLEYDSAVQALYVAYFGRAADFSGRANFEARLAQIGAPREFSALCAAYGSNESIRGLIDAFGISAESNALYSGDTRTFVTAIYHNVLNRDPDAEGLNYWANAVGSGALPRTNAAISIMAGALSNSTEQGRSDAALVNNKITVASNFTFALATNAQALAYAGNAAAATVRDMLGTITATTDTDAFEKTVIATVNFLQSHNSTVNSSSDVPSNAANAIEVVGVGAQNSALHYL